MIHPSIHKVVAEDGHTIEQDDGRKIPAYKLGIVIYDDQDIPSREIICAAFFQKFHELIHVNVDVFNMYMDQMRDMLERSRQDNDPQPGGLTYAAMLLAKEGAAS